jgi:hypothetical protein
MHQIAHGSLTPRGDHPYAAYYESGCLVKGVRQQKAFYAIYRLKIILLSFFQGGICSAFLVSSGKVITAAHCVVTRFSMVSDCDAYITLGVNFRPTDRFVYFSICNTIKNIFSGF